jgi:hypothetical protein
VLLRVRIACSGIVISRRYSNSYARPFYSVFSWRHASRIPGVLTVLIASSPSPFKGLSTLGPATTLAAPEDLRRSAVAEGLSPQSRNLSDHLWQAVLRPDLSIVRCNHRRA